MKKISVNYIISSTCLAVTMLARCAHADVIQARLPQEQHSITPNLIGYNNNWVRKSNVWQNPTMRFLFQKSSSTHLRYPGGSNSSYWDFANDTVFKDLDPARITEEWIRPLVKQDFVNPIEELGLVKKEMGQGFSVIFVANLVTQQDVPAAPARSIKWYRELDKRYRAFTNALNRAEAAGIPIRYIELGNEYYFPSKHYGNNVACKKCGGQGAFPHTGESYATAANYFARRLKADYPDVKIAAIGTIAKTKSNRRRRRWNTEVVSKLDPALIDAITVHFYHGNTPSAGFDQEAGIGQTIDSWNREWVKRAAGSADFDRVPVERDVEGDWDVWYTEFAAFQHKMQDMWHYAFYISNALDYWLNHTNATLISKHAWRSSVNDDETTVKPYVRALSIWSQASANQTKAGRIVLDGAPKVRGSKNDGVIGWMFSGDEKPKATFVNYTSSPQKVDLARVDQDRSNTLTITSVASDNLLAGPIAPKEQKYSQRSMMIDLPPFSVSLVEGIDEKS